jgi:hypothetical protein
MACVKLAKVQFRTKQTSYISGKIKSKLLELVFQAILSDAMQLVQREFRALTAQGQTSSMHIEDGIVKIPLGIGEFAVHGPGASDIRDIASMLLILCESLNQVKVEAKELTPPPSTRTKSPSLIHLVSFVEYSEASIRTSEYHRSSCSECSRRAMAVNLGIWDLGKCRTHFSTSHNGNESATIAAIDLELVLEE